MGYHGTDRKKLNDFIHLPNKKKKNHEMFFIRTFHDFFVKNGQAQQRGDIIKVRLKLCKNNFIFFKSGGI